VLRSRSMIDVRTVERHYKAIWGMPDEVFQWPRGPQETLGKDFAIARFRRPSANVVYATCGMSKPDDAPALELHMITSPPIDSTVDAQAVEILTATAHYHRTQHRLDLHHTVNFGRPWIGTSLCTHGLISLPYLDGPTLEWGANGELRCLWLIPITPKELAFKNANGIEALEERLEKARFDHADRTRPSVI
jgi:Suppressor of fused protein (SUFU)